MTPIPRDQRLDSSLALFSDPYRYISRQCARLQSDIFEARILFKRTVCMTGPDAARVFYDQDHFQRAGAAPEPLRATLFGKRGVQTLDAPAHGVRKALFMHVVDPAAVQVLARETQAQWQEAAARWKRDRPLALYQEAQQVLARAVCRWAGVRLDENMAGDRIRDMISLYDDAARGIAAHMRSRASRRRAETWLASLVESHRAGRYAAPEHSVLHAVATHRDLDGAVLPPPVAAVELLNVLRPTIAVSVYVVWAAYALRSHPAWQARLREAGDEEMHDFLQEVRRYYPFFPAVAARVRETFEWRGHRLAQGRRVLLDLYGINHDPRAWPEPERFDPSRFRGASPGEYAFVPQGGAQAQTNHRCPGEGVAMALMQVAVRFLTRNVSLGGGQADEGVDFRRLPALPRGDFQIVVR